MKMDYFKSFELINQDIEKKERNKMAEKAVYDNLYNKGFRDGLAVLDKIRAELIEKRDILVKEARANTINPLSCYGLDYALLIIDKYKAESEK